MSADERIGSASRAELATRLALVGGRMALDRFHSGRAAARPDGRIVADVTRAIADTVAAEIAAAFPDDVLRNGMPFAGAVYDPISRWLFSACTGRGAWLNDRSLHAWPQPLSERSLVSMRTRPATGLPVFAEDWLCRYRVRHVGSTALHLCYVAVGGLDLVHDDAASPWAIAAAATILLEAGGRLSSEDGTPIFPASAAASRGAGVAIVAGNPASHRQAIDEIVRARVARVAG
jgi:fructose-1,6-bisphosphatase/inositol monophosphatase family enzyme